MFYKGKAVLVTGGSGFVGTHIVAELLKEGAKIRVPIHKRPMVINDKGIETIDADLTIYQDCLRAVRGVEYVFHAAGPVGSAAIGTPMANITTNLILFANVLQASWEENVERFLVLSSSTVYPSSEYPIKEEEMEGGQPHPSYLGYGWMRRYFEYLGKFVALQSKMKIAILRPTAIYGEWDNFDPRTCHVIPALIHKAAQREDPYEVWGSGEEVRDFIHVRDLARGCLSILEKYAVCDAVNIGYGRGLKIKEIVKIILQASGHKDAKIRFDKTKPINIPTRVVDTSKAIRILGFKPNISIEEGIHQTVEWYKKQKGITS